MRERRRGRGREERGREERGGEEKRKSGGERRERCREEVCFKIVNREGCKKSGGWRWREEGNVENIGGRRECGCV